MQLLYKFSAIYFYKALQMMNLSIRIAQMFADDPKYLNPLNDYAFKKVFGVNANKHHAISLVNSLL